MLFFSFTQSTWVFSTDVVVVKVVAAAAVVSFFLFLLLLLSTKEGFVADVGAFWPEEAKCWPSLGCFARCRKAGHY